mmetsp:Transcript_11663/g.31837  ORF Transcript_11663/g.31837 Transcript_11663/m.31837 type:complete len:211 (-) Transcript_11663:574-1206(-)
MRHICLCNVQYCRAIPGRLSCGQLQSLALDGLTAASSYISANSSTSFRRFAASTSTSASSRSVCLPYWSSGFSKPTVMQSSTVSAKDAMVARSGSHKPASASHACTPQGGPMYTSRPAARKATLSNMSKMACRGWWIVQMTACPWLDMVLRLSMTQRAEKASRPLVGSSTKTSAGECTTPAAMLSRRRSPPDSPRTEKPPGSLPPTRCRS